MNWEERIIDGLQRIREVCTCTSCDLRGVDDDFECDYCMKVNERIKEAIGKFSQIFSEYLGNQLGDSFVVGLFKKIVNNLRFVSSFKPEEVDDLIWFWLIKF